MSCPVRHGLRKLHKCEENSAAHVTSPFGRRWTSWSNPVTQGWVLFVVYWLAAAYSRLVDVPFSRLLRGATAGWEHRGEAKLQESKV